MIRIVVSMDYSFQNFAIIQSVNSAMANTAAIHNTTHNGNPKVKRILKSSGKYQGMEKENNSR
ncbi:MAG: hypothetical protein AAF361_06975 [Bacteroidota bacterium]